MANKKGDITFGIKFQTDNSGLNQLKTQLQQLQNLTIGDLINTKGLDNAEKELNDIKKSAQAVEKALEKSFNAKLNTYNLSTFEKEVKKSQGSISQLGITLQKAGAQGEVAFNNMVKEIATNNRHLRESTQLLDQMAETMSNTIRWSIASSALNAMTGSVQRAWSFTKQLDTSLNDIMIVTEKSADDMARFAKSANTAAKNLGAVTTDYTKAALIYYQQGLGDEETAARAATTVKVANVTKQSTDTASEQLTAIWNGYKVSAQEAELYIDKVSAVAADTAADLEELATGMSKVASAANIMGVDIDQLNAQIATIVSVTREAPESIGTALKTVYARMSDIQAGLDEETSYDEYTKQMLEMGVNVLDAKGNLRDMGDVVEEIGEKWNTMNRNQQVALAQTIAGTRQYSRMMSLFDNWDMYESAKMTSENSMGALQAQNEEYLESMEAHLAGLTAQAEELYMALFDAEDINPLIDALTNIVGLFTNMIDVMGGAKGMLMGIGGLGMAVFGDKIAASVGRTVSNVQGFFTNRASDKAQQRMMDEIADGNEGLQQDQAAARELAKIKQEELKIERFLTKEEKEQFDLQFKSLTTEKNKQILAENKLKTAKKFLESSGAGSNQLSVAKGSPAEARKLLSNISQEKVENWTQYAQNPNNFDIFTTVNQDKSIKYYEDQIAQYKARLENPDYYKSKSGRTQAQNRIKVFEEQLEKQMANKATPNAKSVINQGQKIADSILGQFTKIDEDGKLINDAFGFIETQDLEALKRAKETLSELSKQSEYSDKELEELAAALDQVKKSAIQGEKTFEEMGATLEDNGKEAEEAANKYNKFKKETDGFNESKGVETLASGFTSLAGGLSSLAFAIPSVINSFTVIGDESLSTGDKLTQSISGIAMAAPMAISGLTQIKKGYTDLIDSASKAASKIGMTGKGMVNSITAVVAIATVAAITVGTIIDNMDNKLEKTYETLSKAADEAKQRLNESNLEWNELLSSFERLEGLKSDLADLTDGTVEWRKAIADINTEVTQLITKYPELAKFVSRGEDGEMTISAAGQAYLKEAQMEEINRNSFAAASARQRANEANIEARRKDFNESYDNSELTSGGAVAGTLAWTAAGATIGTIITPVIGTIIGAAIGAIAGGIASYGMNVADETGDKKRLEENRAATDEVLEAYLTHGDKIFESETALAKALDKDVNSLTDLHDAMLENTDEVKALAEAYKAERLAEYQNILDMGYALGAKTEGEAALLGQRAQDLQDSEDYSAEAMKEKYGGGNDKDMEAAREYARLAGIKVETLTAKGANKVQLNGEEFSMDEIYQLLAPLKAFEAAQGLNLKNISSITGKFSENELNDFAAIISGDPNTKSFTGLTQEEFANLATLTDAEWSQLAEELGKDVDVLKERFENAMKETGDAWEALMKDMTPGAAALFETYRDSFGNMGLGQQQTIADAFDKISKRYGEDDGEDFLKAVKESGEYSDEIADIIANTDWTQIDNVDLYSAFTDALDEQNIALKPTTINSLVDGIAKATNKTVAKLDEYYQKNAVANEIRKAYNTNGTVSEKLKKKVEQFFPSLSSYIIAQNDGTLKFVTPEGFKLEDYLINSIQETKERASFYGWDTYRDRIIQNNAEVEDKIREVGKAREEVAKTREAWEKARKILQTSAVQGTGKDYFNGSRNDSLGSVGNFLKGKGYKYSGSAIEALTQNPEWLRDYLTTYGSYSKEEIEQIIADQQQYNRYTQAVQDEANKKEAYETAKTNLSSHVSKAMELSSTNLKLSKEEIENFKADILSIVAATGTIEGITVEDWIAQNQDYAGMEDYLKAIWRKMFPEGNTEIEEAIDGYNYLNYQTLLSDENAAVFRDLTTNQGINQDIAFENLYAIENLSSAYEAQNEILEDLIDTYELLGREDRLENIIKQGDIIEDQINNLKAQQVNLSNIYGTIAHQTYDEAKDIFGDGNKITDIEDIRGVQAIKRMSTGQEISPEAYLATQQWAMGILVDKAATKEEKDFATKVLEILANYSSLAEGIADDLSQKVQEKLEANLKEFDMELQVKIEKESIKRDFGEFERELADDDDYAIHMRLVEMDIDSWASELETLTGKGGPLDKLINMNLNDIIEDTDKLKEVQDGQISKAQYQAKIEEYRQLIQENILNIKEAMESLDEMAVDAQEKLNDLYEKQIDYLNTAIKLMENRFKLNKLITGADRQNSDDLKAVAVQYKEIYGIQMKRFLEAQTAYKDLQANPNKYTEERAEQIRDLYFQLAQDASDTYTTMVEAYKTAYEQELVEIIESSFGIAESTLAQLKEEQEWISKGAEHFLDSTDEAYQNEKLAYEYRKAMRDYQDPAIQRRLNDLMEEELDMLKEKDNVTKKDYERAQKRLELEKARIALEEAQQNKTTMQLTRRADGSYGYEYVADSDKLEDLRQNVRDLENELINWDKEALKEQLDTVESMYEEFIKNIQDAFNDDFKIDEMEEKTLRRALKTLQDHLGENEYLLQNWANALDTPVEELMNWTDEQFADANISKGMFDLFNALNNGDMGAAFEAILRDGAAAADFLEELGITFDENGKLKSTQLDDLKPVEEDAKAEYNALIDEITAQQEALDTLDAKLTKTKGIYDSLSTAAVKLCGAMAEVNNLATGNGTGKNAYSVDKIDQYLTSLHTRLQNIPPIATYDTGGYTGAWGGGGKLLLAHEKELILNQEDTQNILNAVNIVRSLESSMFGGLAQLALEGHHNIADIIEGQNFEQNVYITAQFPEATDRDEITEAFRDLVNLATQHVFENNKT